MLTGGTCRCSERPENLIQSELCSMSRFSLGRYSAASVPDMAKGDPTKLRPTLVPCTMRNQDAISAIVMTIREEWARMIGAGSAPLASPISISNGASQCLLCSESTVSDRRDIGAAAVVPESESEVAPNHLRAVSPVRPGRGSSQTTHCPPVAGTIASNDPTTASVCRCPPPLSRAPNCSHRSPNAQQSSK